jgi:hypothetical protein
MGADAHRTVQAEATGAPPREHVLSVALGEQGSANVQLQDPTLYDRREGPCALGVESDRSLEAERGISLSGCLSKQPVGGRGFEGRPPEPASPAWVSRPRRDATPRAR